METEQGMNFNIELKDVAQFIIYGFTLGGLLGVGRNKLKNLTGRVKVVEECLTTPEKFPRFMSYEQHEKKCSYIQSEQKEMKMMITEIHEMVVRLDERSE